MFRPYETSADLAFLVNGGFDIDRCLSLKQLSPFALVSKLPFNVPRDCSVHVGREQVNWDGTSPQAYTGGPLQEVAWDSELKPGDRVEFRGKSGPTLPRWDYDRRELWYGQSVIKRFKFGGESNQEIILKSFDELGWPARIDDPLPPKEGITSKRRLADTIDALNDKHINENVIRFRGDGTGEGVVWDVVS